MALRIQFWQIILIRFKINAILMLAFLILTKIRMRTYDSFWEKKGFKGDNVHYFLGQSFGSVWELFGRSFSEATWFYFSKDFIFDWTTYTIHRSFAVMCLVKVPFDFIFKVEMAQKRENKSRSELWCTSITTCVQFRKSSNFSSIWLIILCMHDRAVTRQWSFDLVVTVIGMVRIPNLYKHRL